jgi:hypothetical protein
MSKLIITTVGTSIISNELYPKEFNNPIKELTKDKPLRDEVKRCASAPNRSRAAGHDCAGAL